MEHACDGRFGDQLVADQSGLDLGGAHAVPGDVDDVVDAAGDEPVAVLVAAATVAGGVVAGVLREVGFEEAGRVTPHAATHARPRGLGDHVAGHTGLGHGNTIGIQEVRLHAEEDDPRNPAY